MRTDFTGAGTGMPEYAGTNKAVAYSAPEGCQLRRSFDLVAWEDVDTPSPFVHEGEPAHYRIDCVIYGGPVSAELSIEAPE